VEGKSGKSDNRKKGLKSWGGQMLPRRKIDSKKHPLDLEKGETSQWPE